MNPHPAAAGFPRAAAQVTCRCKQAQSGSIALAQAADPEEPAGLLHMLSALGCIARQYTHLLPSSKPGRLGGAVTSRCGGSALQEHRNNMSSWCCTEGEPCFAWLQADSCHVLQQNHLDTAAPALGLSLPSAAATRPYCTSTNQDRGAYINTSHL